MDERHVLDQVLDPLLRPLMDEDLWDYGMAVREFSRGVILPRAAAMERAGRVDDEVVRMMAEQGLFGMSIPQEYGGMGAGIAGGCLEVLEIAYADMAASLVPIATMSLFGKAVETGGNGEQKGRILPAVATGQTFGCFGLTEPVGSSFIQHMKTRAERRGDRYVLNGDKNFITEAERADVAIVYARLEGEIAAFLVPNAGRNGGDGYRVTGKEAKPGIRASATCSFALTDVEVPEDFLLGIGTPMERKGYAAALRTLGLSRPTIAAQALGNAKRALAYAMQYAADTPRGDGTARILDKDVYRARLGELTGTLAQGMTYLFAVARALDAGEITRDLSLRIHSSELKAHTTDAAAHVARQAMGLIGGAGYTEDHPLARAWRDSGVAPIYEGHNDVQHSQAGRSIAALLRP